MERSSLDNPDTSRPSDRSSTAVLVAVVFVGALLVRLACFTGLINSDDLWYSQFALDIASGTYRLEPHHYSIRYGVLLPVAAVYGVFGAHEWTSILVPLLGTSAACVAAALIARRYGGMIAAWIVGTLMATFPIDVRYGTILVPEPILQFFLLAAALLFLQARERGSAGRGILAGVCFGVAYLTKEPGAFVAIAFFAFALIRRRWDLAAQLAVGAGAVVVVELAWYWTQTHDLLFRPHAMGVHNRSEMALEANAQLGYRLFKAYPRMMLLPGDHFGLHSLFALILAGITVARTRLKGDVLLLVLWAVVPFLYLDFGSSSFSYYWALPLAPRYISMVYPPVFILAATTLAHAWTRRRELRWAAIGATAVVSVVGFVVAHRERGTGYGTATVDRLRGISAAARTEGAPICLAPSDSAAWQRILHLIDSDLGCGAGHQVRLGVDSAGKPVAADSTAAPGRPGRLPDLPRLIPVEGG